MKLPRIEQYPEELIIGEETYELKFVNRLNGNSGECDQHGKEIWVNKNQSAPEILYTVIHEILHAFEIEHKIKISHKVVYQLERAIGDFLMKNF